MHIDFLLKVFQENLKSEFIVWHNRTYTYEWLQDKITFWTEEVISRGIKPGAVVVLEGNFSPNSIALFLALVRYQCIIVPLTVHNEDTKKEYNEIAQAECVFKINTQDNFTFLGFSRKAAHHYYKQLRNEKHPGLVMFSSGSTGRSKAAVHDCVRLLEKYKIKRHNLRTLTFLLFDHIGGLDTLFYSLSNGSCIITVEDRSPDTVCKAIQNFAVEVLPVSPSFLNLLILSHAYTRYDLSSLKYITYGAEVMPETTLRKCHELFPNITLLQKFGATEVGTLRSKSKASDSTWVKIGGEGYTVRVVDGILHIKADSAILGYLNAPSPFTEDGWFITGDLVEVDGEYMKSLGREKEIINVGGEKVNPAEVENVIYELNNINEEEVSVYGEKNAILGNIICAKISLIEPEDHTACIDRVQSYCESRLENHKVPMKITIVDYKLHSNRFKKMRRQCN